MIHTLATVASPAPYQILSIVILSAAQFSPEVVVGTKSSVVGFDANHRTLQAPVAAPQRNRFAVAVLLPAAFQTRFFIPLPIPSAVFEASKVNDSLLVCSSGFFLEWIFITPVEAVVLLPIPQLFQLDALERDGFCSTTSILVAEARTFGESICTFSWTFLLLPLFLPAPVQLSLAPGISSADSSLVIATLGEPLPLLDACAGVRTG